MIRYYVDPVVCDYGVFQKINDEEPKLCLILNSRANAELIVEILTDDLGHRRHPAVEVKLTKRQSKV